MSKSKESESRVPADLRSALATAPRVVAIWKDLTPIARRDFISWIDKVQEPDTRAGRIEKVCVMLSSGKRRPSGK